MIRTNAQSKRIGGWWGLWGKASQRQSNGIAPLVAESALGIREVDSRPFLISEANDVFRGAADLFFGFGGLLLTPAVVAVGQATEEHAAWDMLQ